ncbi:sporulation related domain protein [Roseovarius mucosus]|uniref:Sporulation related domain protein n=1 Tax=Roseovarius mucosus TaxID=215743 RepID=A0A1V0RU97_9RHOB|nr:SPOR domain-containing protein [Roseovarius mucosus]ARE85256.1 sporulation related domain protein [Roseovarius mucosus]
MRFSSLAILASTVLLLGTVDLSAQSLRGSSEPAEFPPSSFQGRQYVDSAGCVFVRAGVAGNVTWVPRMTRGRDHLCGFQPSLAPSVQAAAPAPAQPVAQAAPRTQPAAPAPSVATAPAPAPRTATAPAPAPRVATAPAPAPRVVRQPAPVAAVQPQRRTASAQAPLSALRPEADPRPLALRPVTARAAAPATAPKTTPIAKTSGKAVRLTQPDPAQSACANLTAVSAAYTVQHNGSPVRCGPQRSPHVTYASGSNTGRTLAPRPGTPATPETVPAYTRVAPARVYASQKTSLVGISVPPGMQPVWEDDRLNPYRAHQTFEGREQMLVMWTNTVPQRLIDRRTGADVIHQFPGLQPPYTSFEAQRAAGVTVATQGRHVPAPMTTRQLAQLRTEPAQAAPRTTVSTRSAPATTAQTAPSHRYAQAGLFADAAQAQAAAQRIAAAGLPARRGTVTRDGRALTLVLAGPFATQSQLDAGADRLRAMGFANVSLRK